MSENNKFKKEKSDSLSEKSVIGVIIILHAICWQLLCSSRQNTDDFTDDLFET